MSAPKPGHSRSLFPTLLHTSNAPQDIRQAQSPAPRYPERERAELAPAARSGTTPRPSPSSASTAVRSASAPPTPPPSHRASTWGCR